MQQNVEVETIGSRNSHAFYILSEICYTGNCDGGGGVFLQYARTQIN